MPTRLDPEAVRELGIKMYELAWTDIHEGVRARGAVLQSTLTYIGALVTVLTYAIPNNIPYARSLAWALPVIVVFNLLEFRRHTLKIREGQRYVRKFEQEMGETPFPKLETFLKDQPATHTTYIMGGQLIALLVLAVVVAVLFNV